MAVIAFVVFSFWPGPKPVETQPTPILKMTRPQSGERGTNAPAPPTAIPVKSAPKAAASAPNPAPKAAKPALPTNAAPPRPVAPVAEEPLSPSAKTNHGGSSSFPRPVQNIFEAQVALARLAIASGSIDGVTGPQTRAAIAAFQKAESLKETGELDLATREKLLLSSPPLTTRMVTSNDFRRLQPLSPDWLGKSRQTALDYESVLELIAEEAHTHPKFIQRLNPEVSWTNLAVGEVVAIPAVQYPTPTGKAAFVTISLSRRELEAFDYATNLLAHFPCSIAQRVEKRPVGELHVVAIAPNPNYTFDPDVFPESPEARQLGRKLIIPPGPNNPVGVAWIGLDRPGYGIHGTPSPEQVGRTESHGCFRLANWNAEYLLSLIGMGTPVQVLP